MSFILKTATRLVSLPMREIVSSTKPTAKTNFLVNRRWAHNMPLTYDFAREKIMLVLRLYDKIDPNKLTLDSHFVHDLGLDSLDHVDIIMELEDEFNFEIPDKDAEKLMRPSDIIRYITDKEEAYKELQDLQAAAHHHHGEHEHDGHSHDVVHNVTAGSHSDHMASNAQKRDFSSWSIVAKRYLSDNTDDLVRPTSFMQAPVKPPTIEDIQERVMKVCSKYDKIDSSQLQLASHLVDDLGLDSLDHVEIMMQLEDEFGLEIPDQEAEKLMRPAEIASYIFHKEDSRKPTTQRRQY